MSSRFSNKFPIPEKFPEILHDFAREVVRYQPKDILDFSIQYFYYLENGLPLNYTLGGSSTIPKSLIDKEKPNRDNLTTPNSVGKTNNSTAKQFYSHPENDNEKNNRKESAQRSVTAIEIDKIKHSGIDEDVDEEKKSSDRNVPLSNEMRNLIGIEKPLTTFSGISGTDSIKKGVRDFTNELIGNCKESVKSTSNMYNNSSQAKENNSQSIKTGKEGKNDEDQRISTFSGISGTESQKNEVRAFIKDVVTDSKEDAKEKLKNKI